MNKRLVILGGGESGVGTAILGKKMGYDVFVSDFGAISDTYKAVLNQYELVWEEKQHTESLILNADVVMKSPGIPEKAPIIQKLVEKNIAVISEIEFAFPYTHAKTIGITGSNGKTIVKEWLAELLSKDLNVVKSPRSFNSQIGVPLSILQIRAEHQLGFFEAGISRPDEMACLQKIIQPPIKAIYFS